MYKSIIVSWLVLILFFGCISNGSIGQGSKTISDSLENVQPENLKTTQLVIPKENKSEPINLELRKDIFPYKIEPEIIQINGLLDFKSDNVFSRKLTENQPQQNFSVIQNQVKTNSSAIYKIQNIASQNTKFLIVDTRPDFLPLTVEEKKIEKTFRTGQYNEKLAEHLDKINTEQVRIKNKIKSSVPTAKFRTSSTKVLNMVSAEFSPEEKKIVEKILPEGVKIYPDTQYKATLMDSVPLINADEVWQLDASQNNCIENNSECLTGKGITIGILDTGIDYTLDAFGNCSESQVFGNGELNQLDLTKAAKICSTSPCNVSEILIGSRDNILGNPEPNQPNTVSTNCVDGSNDRADSNNESIESIEITNQTGGNFEKGQIINVQVTANCFSNQNIVQTYFRVPRYGWIEEKSLNCPGPGLIEVSNQFTLGDSDGNYVIRASITTQFQNPQSNCAGDPNADNDDVVITVDSSNQNPNCKVIGGYDFVNYDYDPMDDHGHGTHVAAIAAGNELLKGVAPDAKIVSYKVLNAEGSGNSSQIISAIDRSIDPNNDGNFDDHLDVINLSLGTYCWEYDQYCGPDDATSKAIDNATEKGVVVVVAAGNDGPWIYSVGSPGTSRKAITVGAIDKQLNLADFSSRGPVYWTTNNYESVFSLVKPDVLAPGVSICASQSSQDTIWSFLMNVYGIDSHCLDEKHISISGTSMATPHVTGIVALAKQRNKNYTPDQIKSIIKNSAEFLPGQQPVTQQGLGIVNAPAAVFFNEPLIAVLDPIEIRPFQTNLDITGIISGNNFSYYKLSYGPTNLNPDSEQNWTIIATKNTIPQDEILLQNFDLLEPNMSFFLIRLEVFDTSSKKYTDYSFIKIEDKFESLQLLNNDIINSNQDLEFKFKNNYGLQVTNIEFGYSINGQDWTNNGGIIDPENVKVTIPKNFLPSNGEIDFFTRIYFGEKYWVVFVNDLKLDNSLKLGWPVKINAETPTPFSYDYLGVLPPAVGDVIGDAQKEIIIFRQGENPKVMVFSQNGMLLNEWQTGNDFYALNRPLLVDLDFDGKDEIIAASTYRIQNTQGESILHLFVYAYNGYGSVQQGWPREINFGNSPDISVKDLDLDNVPEIIVKTNIPGQIIILNVNGEIVNQWQTTTHHWGGDLFLTTAFGNFDSDPELEIVSASPSENSGYDQQTGEITDEGKIFVYNLDGSIVSGWPQVFPGNPFYSPVIGDIDNDGQQEIIIGTMINSSQDTENKGGLYAFKKNGELINGWPKFKGNPIYSSPSLFDIENDGYLEIGVSILGEFKTYILDHSGNTLNGWPQQTTWNNYDSTSIGSIMGELGLLAPAGSIYQNTGLYGWKMNGQTISSFPKPTETGTKATPIIEDIDNDGTEEIIATSAEDFDISNNNPKKRGTIYVWETESQLNPEKQLWPRFQHDKGLSGCYDCKTPPIAPTDLHLVSAGTSGVNIAWNDNSGNETQFIVRRLQGSNAVEYNVNANTTTFTNNQAFTPGTTYSYFVYAVNQAGASNWSNIIQVTIPTTTTGTGSFLPGTQITMSDKTSKNIEEVEVGDLVLSYDVKNDSIVPAKVTGTLSHEMPGYYIIDGHLKITATNPVWANEKWMYPPELKIGNKLLNSDGKPDLVNSIRFVKNEVTVYNLQVEGTHTYFAGGIGVHNRTAIGVGEKYTTPPEQP